MKKLLKAAGKIGSYRMLNSTNRLNISQASQLILINQYKQLANNHNLPSFQNVGCHFHSQTDEDGFLLYIFALVGISNKKVVEICAGDGIECNAANLIINHGWQGLLFDGDAASIKIGQNIYGFLKTTRNNPPQLVHAWVTAENINELISSHGFIGEIDLLSLDIDGVDYWIWKSIECINPRVVVLEYNTYWDAKSSYTVPYDPNFQAQIIDGGYYCGASLAAYTKLAKVKGYRLVGCNTQQYNAFFVRNDLGVDVLPEVSVENCISLHTKSDSINQYNAPDISQFEWEQV